MKTYVDDNYDVLKEVGTDPGMLLPPMFESS